MLNHVEPSRMLQPLVGAHCVGNVGAQPVMAGAAPTTSAVAPTAHIGVAKAVAAGSGKAAVQQRRRRARCSRVSLAMCPSEMGLTKTIERAAEPVENGRRLVQVRPHPAHHSPSGGPQSVLS